MIRRLARLAGMPAFVKGWLAPAWLTLGACRLATSVLSLGRIMPLLGAPAVSAPSVPLLSPAQQIRAEEIGGLVRLAARHTPWTSDCMPQALTAWLLMALYGVPRCLCVGVLRDAGSGDLFAHAWLSADRVAVTGGDGFARYRVICCFVATGRG